MTNDMLDMHNQISTEELKRILSHQLKELFAHPDRAGKIPPLMVWGAPGIGKSSVLRSVAEELGISFVDVRLAQREPVDIRGLPVPKGDKVSWLVSSDWPSDSQSRGIILFDELTAADRSLQVAAYEFILDRRLGELYRVPDGWYICAAGNRVEDAAVARTMSSALANRFLHVELREDVEAWIHWGLQNAIHPAVLGFVRFRPDLLFHQENENLERGWPSPRSWERVSVLLDSFGDTDDFLCDKMIYGLVGNQAGVEFCAYRRIAGQFEDVLALMMDESKAVRFPEKPDLRYAFCSALVYHLWRGTSPEDESQRVKGFFRIAMSLPSDFATMAMMDAMVGNGKEPSAFFADKLFNHPSYSAWAKAHGKAMRARLK